jgi:spermidine synthase
MVDRQLYSGKSGFQRIDVFESEDFGRFFTLDGCIMTTEKDEFIYHEMITHVPMAVNPGIKNILVVGAGDGGVIRELTRYETVRNIDLVEIDKLVIEVCKKYLPVTSCSLDDERVNIYYEDGIGYIRQTEKKYDLIIVDSTDPVGPGESLFTKEFYENCYKALTQDGIMVNQHASPFYPDDIRVMQQTHGRIFKVFPVSEVYQAHIPTYPSGHWLFGFASKKLHPVNDLDAAKWNALGIKTKYYNTRLHTGAFALPNYAEELLRKAENKEI